uniref:Uncharacterized protein n=1 Tax=Catagonus wagneri TaxID=51154 RepID=A0A8C3W969_9CETA
MSQEKMELARELQPSSSTTEDNTLRRSNSAPLISGLGDNSQVFQADTLGTRRNSTFLAQRCPLVLSSPSQASVSHLDQNKQEEGMDSTNRETMYEWELQTAIQLNRSWKESLNRSNNDLEKPSSPKLTDLIPASPTASVTGGIRKSIFRYYC